MSNRRQSSFAALFVAVTASVAVSMLTFGQPPADQPQQPSEQQLGDAAFRQRDWNAAVEHYRKAIADGMDHGGLHMRLGYALHALGRYEEALPSHLRAAGVAHPEIRIDGLYNAACAYALLNKKDQALECFAKAIDAGFEDVEQVAKDTDLDSLRADERFKKMVDGIGKTPRFHEQMNFFIGEWSYTALQGEVVVSLKITRPLANSHALISESTNQGDVALTGMLWPDFQERVWRWTEVDGLGTTRSMVGKMNDDGSITFSGRDASAAGPGATLRLTFAPQPDGRVREKCEVSEDEGRTWRVHHEEFYSKKTAAQ